MAPFHRDRLPGKLKSVNYLGLDYGSAHIGIAIATGPLASPLTTVPASTAVPMLKSLVEKHDISALVIGVSDSSTSASVAKLADQLSFLRLPVYLVDETLSSHEARQALLHTTKSRRRDLEHAASAAIILQSWLDTAVLDKGR